MDITLALFAFVLSLVGIVGCVVPVLPGTAFSYLALLCGYATSYSKLESGDMWIWLAISLLVILVDTFFPVLMTKVFGGTKAGTKGALVGLILGFFAGPVGVVFGPFFGAVVGELLHDKTQPAKAFRVGFGSFLSFILGTGIKLITSLMMFYMLIEDTYSPLKDWVVSCWA